MSKMSDMALEIQENAQQAALFGDARRVPEQYAGFADYWLKEYDATAGEYEAHLDELERQNLFQREYEMMA